MKKKRILSFLLAAMLLLPALPSGLSAFNDIPYASESAAAETLASLGIVASVEQFNPARSLSRAEFCKMAVLAAGFNERSLYSSYTLYPDVNAAMWYAPYINAAISKYKIIQGYPNGNFGPNDTITFGQAATILLRMLGYTTADIGPLWPRDYVIKATAIGLSNGMNMMNANDAIPRGQAAIMLRNLLLANTKDGGPFLNTGFTAGTDMILAATHETDPAVTKGTLKFISLTGETSLLADPGTIPASMIGSMGETIFEKNTPSKLKGFMLSSSMQEATVKAAAAQYLDTDAGRITIPRDAKAFVAGQLGDYATSWFDLPAGGKITIYYDDQRNIQLISANQTASFTDSLVYGVSDTAIPTSAKLLYQGNTIALSDLKKYDILSYSAQDNAYLVSDRRVTLLYEEGSPVYTNPARIKAGGHDYIVPEKVSSYFKNLALNQTITLCFDASGNLAAVFPSSEISGNASALLSKLSASGEVTLSLANSKEFSGKTDLGAYPSTTTNQQTVSSLFRYQGQLMNFSQTAQGNFSLTPVSYSTAYAGKLDLAAGTLGGRKLSPQAVFYELPAQNMPLRRLSRSDLTDGLPASRILHTELDRTGAVETVVFDNITGNGFQYGILKQKSHEVEIFDGITRTEYELTLRTAKGETVITSYYPVPGVSGSEVPGAVASAISELTYPFATPGRALALTGSVSRTAFDSLKGVRYASLYIPLASDVQVYAKPLNRFLTLQEARANFTGFELYCDSDPASGGHVRLIIAS